MFVDQNLLSLKLPYDDYNLLHQFMVDNRVIEYNHLEVIRIRFASPMHETVFRLQYPDCIVVDS